MAGGLQAGPRRGPTRRPDRGGYSVLKQVHGTAVPTAHHLTREAVGQVLQHHIDRPPSPRRHRRCTSSPDTGELAAQLSGLFEDGEPYPSHVAASETVASSHNLGVPAVALVTSRQKGSAAHRVTTFADVRIDGESSSWSADDLRCLEDDDVVLDTPASLLRALPRDAEATRYELSGPKSSDAAVSEDAAPHTHPAGRGVGQDVIDMVTDAFTEQREAEVRKRREVLYALTHPTPSDYTYMGKLVPPPPLSFGQITEEARRLGNQIMLGQHYSLVNEAGLLATSTEGNQGGATAEVSLVETASPRRRSAAKAATLPAYRSRKRERNIFRDHNYFFEINELYQEIVLVGKACAGKSSLLNALLGQQVARTSSTPNTTRAISFYQSVTPEELQAFHAKERHNLVKLPGGGLQLTFVDMPGFGIEGMSDRWRDAAIELTDAYFGVRRSVNTVLFCIDCERGLTKGDIKYFTWLENVQGVFYIILTKCDSVPHSRVCAVMKQIYVLITKNRRKYRKVFPFILPVSALDGTNIEVLRGLITETSGMLPGDTLRELLTRKQKTIMTEALREETARIDAVRAHEREKACAEFLATSPALPLQSTQPQLAETYNSNADGGTQLRAAHANGSAVPSVAHSERRGDAQQRQSQRHVQLNLRGDSATGAGVRYGTGLEQRQDREEFLAWRQMNPLETQATPYGSVRYRINTGLESPATTSLTIGYDDEVRPSYPPGDDGNDHAPADRGNVHTGRDAELPPSASSSLAVPPAASQGYTSSVIGLSTNFGDSPAGVGSASSTGVVSRFIDTLSAYSRQGHHPGARRRTRERERRWQRGYSPSFLAEGADGRLAEFRGGVRCGPSLVSVAGGAQSQVATRKAAWRAEQLKHLLHEENAAAPWAALRSVSQKLDARKEEAALHGMTNKDVAAYVRNAGRVTESFEKFESEVTAVKYMNEIRQTKTLRSQQQMHLNATAKINYRSMPPGLWKRYGEKDSYWPTSHVLGRDSDESHVDSHHERTLKRAASGVRRPRRRRALSSPSSFITEKR